MSEISRRAVAGSCLRLRSLYPFVLHALVSKAGDAGGADTADQRAALTVVDLPCGDGLLTYPLAAAGYRVRPLDLFPEYLNAKAPAVAGRSAAAVFAEMSGERLPVWLARGLYGPAGDAPVPTGLKAEAADMEGRLPLEDASVDVLVCVEGIEHVVDRHRVLAEFRRVLKPGGRLLLTTPNLLSGRARLAYALSGQRALRSYVDEYTSVWGVSPDGGRIYHGHAFLINYFQLRYSLFHSGLRLRRLWPGNWSLTSVALWPLLRPLVSICTRRTQRRARAKFEGMKTGAAPPYDEMLAHLVSPELLLNATLIVEATAAPVPTPVERAATFAATVFAPP